MKAGGDEGGGAVVAEECDGGGETVDGVYGREKVSVRRLKEKKESDGLK